MRHTWIACTLLAALFSASGCARSWSSDKEAPTKAKISSERPAIGPTKVVVDGPALALGQPEQGLQQRQRFAERFANLMADQRFAAAQLWVERHPDIALDVLRDGVSERIEAEPLKAMAQFHDNHCGSEPQHGWQASLGLSTSPAGQAYYEARAKALMHLRNAQFEEAARIELSSAAKDFPRSMIAVDALQLTGVARMLANDAQGAAVAFEEAVTVAMPIAPLQGAHALLLLSEARRRAGDNDGANQAWADAVVAGGQLLSRDRPVFDPTFWDRAFYLAPVGIPWPAALGDDLVRLSERPHIAASLRSWVPLIRCSLSERGTVPAPAILLAGCGLWRMDRGESQAALLLLKRAEAAAPTPDFAAWCQLSEAYVLTSLEQAAAATAVLMQLAASNDRSPVTLAAIAAIGSAKVRQGQTMQGVTLLRKALEENPHSYWPTRPNAEADLALALLIAGEERSGLRWLEEARSAFAAQGDREAVAQCVWNEARYWEQANNKDRVAELDRQHASMQF